MLPPPNKQNKHLFIFSSHQYLITRKGIAQQAKASNKHSTPAIQIPLSSAFMIIKLVKVICK